MKPVVSIIIPSKNAGIGFRRTLDAIRSQRFSGEVQLLVIDSGSTDQTLEVAAAHCAEILSIPAKEFNHGGARQYAMQMAKGDVFILLSQDAQPEDNLWLNTIVATFVDERIGGVYVRQIPRDNADILTKRNLTAWPTGRREFAVQEIADPEAFKRLSPVAQFYLCIFDDVCSAIRRTAWNEIPMQPTYFGEDIEWSKHALLAGWRIAYQPSAAVIHSHNRSVLYEYKRQYVTLHKLYELFGLSTVPNMKAGIQILTKHMMDDWQYVWTHETRTRERIRLSARIPLSVLASVVGQYRGAADASKGMPPKVSGV